MNLTTVDIHHEGMDVTSVTSQLYVLFLRSICIHLRTNMKYSKWKLRLANKFQAIQH